MTPPHSFPPPGPPPASYRQGQGRGVAAAVLSVAAVLVVGIVVLTVVMLRGALPSGLADLPGAGGAPAPSASASPSPTPVELSTPTADAPEALTDATVANWKGVAVPDYGIAYDVPQAWFAADPGVITGFEEPDPDAPFGYSPTVAMSGVAEFGARQGPCHTYPPGPGTSGISGEGEPADTAQTAPRVAEAWAVAAYGNDNGDPEVSLGEAVPFAANGLTGHQVTATVKVPEFECYPGEAQVRAVSFAAPQGGDVYHFVVYADASGDEGPNLADVDTMVSTLRPLA
ncbi:hypothetical protein LG943_00180 [Streptomonospora sp. S1-112]|uniref:DUF8017 domain-containing protein n=1 Tax=Streptomonospora mangrovi TaxID=2883123 RepID=A0A9X3NGL4_9ACTN|nr:hypothetical protein [Streptomonospora mangrovi]MDA0562763.1 hypothetical protein [Streptomonospora mangrovi]